MTREIEPPVTGSFSDVSFKLFQCGTGFIVFAYPRIINKNKTDKLFVIKWR